MEPHSRRQAALDAIEAVLNGATAGSQETEVVDFKEEAGTVGRGGARQAIDAQHEPAARALASEAACLANSKEGGALVVGVDDKASGTAAFVGTYLDTDWLRERIYALTQPNLTTDVIEELEVAGQRLYLVNIGPALAETRVDGKLRGRFGTDCQELSGDQAREFLERRRKYDWSSEASGKRLSDATDEALTSAHHHYQEQRGSDPGSDLVLARRLGITIGDDDDPELNRAGALLLCEFEPDLTQLEVLVTDAEGVASRERTSEAAPLLPAFDRAWELLTRAFPASDVFVGAQRQSVRVLPEPALREAVINAIMHRDYDLPRSLILVLATGDPASALKVRSPGGFPPGVNADRLLVTPSRPRNPALANAMHVLGLAEREGVGIDTMFRVMLRDGHPRPDIVEDAGEVVCRLSGGRVDPDIRKFFRALEIRDRSLGKDVRAHLAIAELLTATPLRPERLARVAQATEDEAFEVLTRLVKADVVERLLDGSRSFRLNSSAQSQLKSRISYAVRQSLDERWELVRAYLDANDRIGRDEAATLFGVKPERASAVLSKMASQGRIETVRGQKRGRGVRYRLSS